MSLRAVGGKYATSEGRLPAGGGGVYAGVGDSVSFLSGGDATGADSDGSWKRND